MRPYEVVMIFDSGAEQPAIQAVVERALDVIKSSGGNPGAIDRWGKRQLAYEVKHRRDGYYVVIELTGVNQTVNELNRLLTLADEVLRYKVLRIPDKIAGRKGLGAPVEVAPAQEAALAAGRPDPN